MEREGFSIEVSSSPEYEKCLEEGGKFTEENGLCKRNSMFENSGHERRRPTVKPRALRLEQEWVPLHNQVKK